MEGYQKNTEYPLMHDEAQEAIEKHKRDIAQLNASAEEKAIRFRDNMPVDLHEILEADAAFVQA